MVKDTNAKNKKNNKKNVVSPELGKLGKFFKKQYDIARIRKYYIDSDDYDLQGATEEEIDTFIYNHISLLKRNSTKK